MLVAEVEPNLTSRLIAQLRSGAWLDRKRVLAYGRILLIVELVGLLAIAAGTYGLYVKLEAPSSTDFISFYAAGQLADLGTPALAYDPVAHFAMERKVFGDPNLPYAYYFFYPPTFLLLCAALALLPYLVSFAVSIAASAAVFVFSLRVILTEWALTVALFSFPPTVETIGIGQNSFLTAGLLGAGTYLVDRAPLRAGLLFGAIVYKPHLLMMVPVALIAGRRWRALAATIGSAAGIVAFSALVFGPDTWVAFLTKASGAADSFSSGRVGFAGLVSLFAAARLLGAGVSFAAVLQGLALLAAAILTALVWWRGQSLAIRSLVLLAATLISPPVILFYDLLPAAVAVAWLSIDARRTGFLPWEKTVLCIVWVVPILSRGVGIAWGVPLGPVATIGLFALAAVRARNEMRMAPL
jgi:alpha-1,2-mannosyltransferase